MSALTGAAFMLSQKSESKASFAPITAELLGGVTVCEWGIDREALNYHFRLGLLDVVKVVFCLNR